MKNIRILLLLMISLAGCGINKQAKEFKALEKCDFKINSADSLYIAGSPIEDVYKDGEIDLSNLPSLAFAMLRKNVPLSGRLNLNIENPGSQKAGINQFEYLILIQDKEIANGFVNQKVMIAPGEQVSVPVNIKLNAYNLLADKDIMKAFKVLTDSQNTDSQIKSVLTIKIKPSIAFGNKLVKYPGYITVNREISKDILL